MIDKDNTLILSISSWLTSAGSAVGAMATKSNILWIVSVSAGLYSLYCSYLTHRKLKRDKKIK